VAGDVVPPGGGTHAQLTWAADACLHEVPRAVSDPEEVGPFTLFRPRGTQPYYARPRPGAPAPSADDLRRLDERCAELGLPLTVHWVVDRSPGTGELCRDHGLLVRPHPLLVTTTVPDASGHRLEPAIEVDVLTPGSGAVADALACTAVAFAAPGVGDATGGVDELHLVRRLIPDDRVDATRDRIADGTTAWTVARQEGAVVAAAQYQRVGAGALITSVATLPDHRRRGLAGVVAARLVRDALERGVTLVVLVAEEESVADVFAHAGLTRLGSAGLATR